MNKILNFPKIKKHPKRKKEYDYCFVAMSYQIYKRKMPLCSHISPEPLFYFDTLSEENT